MGVGRACARPSCSASPSASGGAAPASATSRPRSCSRSSPAPTCRARSSPSSSSTVRRGRSSTSASDALRDRWLPIAADRRRAVLHRHQRDRSRQRGRPHAGPPHPGRRRLPARRLQELRDRRPQGAARASCGAGSPAARACGHRRGRRRPRIARVEVTGTHVKMGLRATSEAELAFDDVRIEPEDVLVWGDPAEQRVVQDAHRAHQP